MKLFVTIVAFVVVVFVVLDVSQVDAKPAKCPEKCDRKACPKAKECRTGIVKDRCNCCNICGLEEGQVCNMNEKEFKSKDMAEKAEVLAAENDFEWQGYCGFELACKVRHNVRLDIEAKRYVATKTNITVCHCKNELEVCGSDGNTYGWCQMNAMQSQTNGEVSMKAPFPCQQRATVKEVFNESKHVKGGKVLYGCRAEGFPKPIIKWRFISSKNLKNQNFIDLPGYMSEISVTTRPNLKSNRMFTSFLQIKNYNIDNEGIYICEAKNDQGEDSKAFTSVME